MVTDPLRMAAVLVYAYQSEAEQHAEMRERDAADGGDRAVAQWWCEVRAAIDSLREHQSDPDETMN